MDKKTLIIGAVVFILAAVISGIITYNGLEKKYSSNITVSSVEDLTALVDQVYEGVSIEMPMLMTMPVDTEDVDAVKSFTGLDSAENIECAVVSEPMMSSQAYSMVLVKVKDGANANAIAKTMNENVDARKWICVTAERVYSAASGNVICLVMSNEETSKTVFESFKTLAGGIKEENVRVESEPEMPEDMLPGSMEIPEDMPIDDQPAAM